MKQTFALFCLLCCAGSAGFGVGGGGVTVISEPTPLFSGLADARPLQLDKTFEEIPDPNLRVFAGVCSTAVDKSGSYYLFDARHGTIIKLDANFKFIRTIGRAGEGAGEFKTKRFTANPISIGRDQKLYLVNWLGRRIYRYSLKGEYLDNVKYDKYGIFIALADPGGNMYLPSTRGHILDVHGPDMAYKRSLLPTTMLKTFLFQKPPACAIARFAVPGQPFFRCHWLGSGELVFLNPFDLSITIFDPQNGKTRQQFYAWDDYILEQLKIRIDRALRLFEESGNCRYATGFVTSFVDHRDNILAQFSDSHMTQYLYRFSKEGHLLAVFKVVRDNVAGIPIFFHFHKEKNRYVAYTDHGVHLFKIAGNAQ